MGGERRARTGRQGGVGVWDGVNGGASSECSHDGLVLVVPLVRRPHLWAWAVVTQQGHAGQPEVWPDLG